MEERMNEGILEGRVSCMTKILLKIGHMHEGIILLDV